MAGIKMKMIFFVVLVFLYIFQGGQMDWNFDFRGFDKVKPQTKKKFQARHHSL